MGGDDGERAWSGVFAAQGGGVVVQEYLLFCSLTTNCSRLGTRSWHESSTPAAH